MHSSSEMAYLIARRQKTPPLQSGYEVRCDAVRCGAVQSVSPFVCSRASTRPPTLSSTLLTTDRTECLTDLALPILVLVHVSPINQSLGDYRMGKGHSQVQVLASVPPLGLRPPSSVLRRPSSVPAVRLPPPAFGGRWSVGGRTRWKTCRHIKPYD